MPVTIDPAVEACEALVDRINSGTAYTLARPARYAELETTALEKIKDIEIDVVPGERVQLNRTFQVEDISSHTITIWIREKLPNLDNETINARKLLVAQIWQRVNNFDSADRRVRVWGTNENSQFAPDKEKLRTMGLFSANIILRVEVEASP